MLRDWGVYELMRKNDNLTDISDGTRRRYVSEALHLDPTCSLLVGNLNNQRNAWLVISVLRGRAAAVALRRHGDRCMTWFRIDDSFYDHPKVFDAPDCAVALWTRAGTWAARNLTDGFVPSGMPARLCDDPDTAVRELVRRGLWKRTTGGFQFHDWTDFQPTAEAVKTLREQRAEAGRKGGKARAARHQGPVDNSSDGERKTPASASGMNPLPNRQDPNSPGAVAAGDSVTSASVANGKQPSSKSQASASPVAKQNATPARPGPAPSGLGGGVTPGGTHARESPPDPRCDQHRNNPDPPPCGRCAEARKTRERWETDRRARQDEAQRCRRHRGQLAHNCALCRSEQLAAPDQEPG